MRQSMWVVSIWLVLQSVGHAASFDCSKAQSMVEKLVCADAELSTLDEELASAYTKALHSKRRTEEIKNAQRQWLKGRNRCIDTDCVREAYMNRLSALAQSSADVDVCAELKAMLQRPAYEKGSVELLAVETIQDPLSGNRYPNLDVDGDRQFDYIAGGCSDSSEPADGCMLSYRLTRSGESITHQFPPHERFFVINYKKKILVISSERKPLNKILVRHVYEFAKSGLHEVCK